MNNIRMRADLHMHGTLGFQPYWLKKQGYAGKNPLQLIIDKCFKEGITVSAITCKEDTFGEESVENRLDCLMKYEVPLLEKSYSAEKLGKNLLLVKNKESFVYLVNGQTVIVKDKGVELDLLVVGSSNVKENRPISDTAGYCRDHGLIFIAEHPYLECNRGIGKERLEKNIDLFDAIEGHNAQIAFGREVLKIPIIGNVFSRVSKELNEKAKETARKFNKPYLANSDAHRIEDIGIAYTEWIDNTSFPFCKSEEEFMVRLKNRIRSGDFITKEGYESLPNWFRWYLSAERGRIFHKNRIKRQSYIPSNILR